MVKVPELCCAIGDMDCANGFEARNSYACSPHGGGVGDRLRRDNFECNRQHIWFRPMYPIRVGAGQLDVGLMPRLTVVELQKVFSEANGKKFQVVWPHLRPGIIQTDREFTFINVQACG